MTRAIGPGSLVDVVAPAGPFDVAAFERGLEVLREAGLRVRHRPDVTARTGFLAGDDARRLAELREALAAGDSDLIWCARGGYGTTRIVEQLSIEEVRRAGKVLVGFSDITVLHALWRRAGVPSIHGSMVARLATEPAAVRERLFSLVFTGEAGPLAGVGLRAGRARGRVGGGNVAMLAALCGTPFQPAFGGAIVFLEDVGERPYRLDRMLVQCRQAGIFDGVVGVVLGEFAGCDEPDGTMRGDEVVRRFVEGLGLPAVAGLPSGHGAVNQAIPFGVTAALDGEAGTLTFEEPLFERRGQA